MAELGLEGGTFADLASTNGTITVNDPDGIQDIATVTIAGKVFTLAQLQAINPSDPLYQIPLEAKDGDPQSEGTLVLTSFNPVTGEIGFTFILDNPVNNANPESTSSISDVTTTIPLVVTVTDQSGESSTASGGILILDATP
ncbi:hypothetical protein, partial [Cyanobium sp. ATX-6F1]|uniref:hypothetical protein n=1 Tax=Cyanobium sp. ATX-6F1 TaxID=3137388 RepID=UPI0039BDFC76